MKKYFIPVLLGCVITPAWATDLMEVYSLAAQSDPVYKAAASTRLSQREALPQSVAAILPSVVGSANTTGNRMRSSNLTNTISGTTGTHHYNSRGYSLTLDQPLLNFSNWLNVDAARYTAKQADANLAAAAQDLIIRVATSYFGVLQAQDNLRFIQAEKAAYSRQLEQAKARYSVGLDAVTTVYNAQASYDAAVASEISAQNTLHNNQEALRQLTGQSYPDLQNFKVELPLLTPQPNDVEQWVNTATQNNATLFAQTYAMEAARQNIKVKFGNHLPSVDLVGNYGRTAQNGPTAMGSGKIDGRSVGLQLSVPIFSGGADSSLVRQAQDDFQTASANRELQYRQTVVMTRQKFNDVLAGISKVSADKQAILSAQASVDSTEESYKVGTRTIVDVLNAQGALYQAKSNYSRDEYGYLIDTLNLKQAAGILAPNDLTEINNWLHGTDQRDQTLVGTHMPSPKNLKQKTRPSHNNVSSAQQRKGHRA